MLGGRKEKKLTLDKDEQLRIEHSAMFDDINRLLPLLSKKDLQRMVLLLIAPKEKETYYLSKIKDKKAKQVYMFAAKCAGVKQAFSFKEIVNQRKKEEENKND